MKKFFGLSLMMVFVLAGCGSTETQDAAGTIGFVSDTGGINDKSFNQGTWEGVEAFGEENGYESSYIETKDVSQIEQNLSASAAENEIVVAAGFTFATPIYNVAQANTDTDFILIDSEPTNEDGDVEELDNVHSYLFNEQEAGYLVGYIAGKSTETDRVGFVGGMQSPPVQKFGVGYVAGAQAANPDVIVDFNYTGTFEDVGVGKTTANTMYAQGADIVFGAAGGTNTGIIEAAKEQRSKDNDVWMIGVDRDMYEDGIYDGDESLMLTSAMKMVDVAASEGLADHYDGNFTAGSTVLGYTDNGVGLPEENPNLDQALVDEAKDALENAASVPASAEDLDAILEIEVNGEY